MNFTLLSPTAQVLHLITTLIGLLTFFLICFGVNLINVPLGLDMTKG